MPDIIAGSDISTRGGGEIALDHHVDGGLTVNTPNGSVHLTKQGALTFKRSLKDISRSDDNDGKEDWITQVDNQDGRPYSKLVGLVRKDGDDTYSLRLPPNDDPSLDELGNAPALQLSGKDLTKIDDALFRMESASRIDTGHGDLDIFITDDNKFGFRNVGDNGRPVETKFDAKSFAKLNHAIDVVVDGFDDSDPNGPDEGVTRVDVKTNAGTVRVELTGNWRGTTPDDRLKITPVGGGTWSIDVAGAHQSDLHDALSKVSEAGEGLDFYDPFGY
ncbi:hypothetical protein [Streptosporangium sp. NPDC051022]|uniref:hypothetical protein n=1 Tax=Streptosporangium sp. NPDC051022 TaxID=3155752 RepID=UPI00341C03CF